MKKEQVMIVAGEASGDLHAAGLVAEFRRRAPEVHFFGIGGNRMRAEGVETIVDADEMAVVGLVEVLIHYRRLKRVLEQMRQLLRERRPDLLILVDYPGFNLALAATAKGLGIPVLFYISPQIWAWRPGRIKTIAQRVDMMAVIFPFEEPIYREAGVPVRFVGHPLTRKARSELTRDQALAEFGLDPARKCLGLFPGSRRSELQKLLPDLLAAAERLRGDHPDLQFILPIASSLSEADVGPYLEPHPDLSVKLVSDRPYDVMRACDAIVSSSGTATLEIALLGTPLAVIYRISALSYALARRLVTIPYISLCNIVAGHEVAKELLQKEASPQRIAAEAERLLYDAAYADTARRELGAIPELLRAGGDGSSNVARLALEMLGRADSGAPLPMAGATPAQL